MPRGPKPLTWEEVLERIHAKIKRGDPDDCWEWQGSKSGKGYGMIQARAFSNQPLYVHRIILGLKLGRELLDSEEAMHSCDNPPCNNPSHLFSGGHIDNMRDAKSKGRLVIGGRTGGTWVKGGGRAKDQL